MTTQPKLYIDDVIYAYTLENSSAKPSILNKIRSETATISFANSNPNRLMLVAPEVAHLMALIASITQAKKYIEVGVFTGFNVTNMTLAMGKDGLSYALDNNQEYIDIASSFWQEANCQHQIVTMVDDACNSLNSLVNNKEHCESFDIAFIDADKASYLLYYKLCYRLVKPGGIIFIDNVLMHGKVSNSNTQPAYVQGVRQLNQYLKNDASVIVEMLPIGDGLSIVYKK